MHSAEIKKLCRYNFNNVISNATKSNTALYQKNVWRVANCLSEYMSNTLIDVLTFLKFEHFHATNKLKCLSNFSSKITNLTLENDHVCSIQTTEHNYCLTNLLDRISKYSSVSCRICICTFFFEHNTKEWGRITVNCK